MNPIFPSDSFVPDGEVRRMPDGRVYLYGSYDIGGAEDFWCSDVLHVFSSDDLVHWTDHGVSFALKDIPWAQPDELLLAPDCIYRDGKYHLYFCMVHGREGVAVSDSPAGPFVNPQPMKSDWDGIDPSVFIDDDGQGYYFWGQFSLRGAKLRPDMLDIEPDTIHRGILTEWTDGFHEGSSIRKRNGLYYMVYADFSRGDRPTCMSYAVAQSPLGPYEKRGVIIDNIDCDPHTHNNHGSIFEFDGQWYVAYHRSSRNGWYNRRMCMEPIFFDENGDIAEVPMTTQGVEGPLPMNASIDAARACFVRRGPYIDVAEDRSGEILTHIAPNSYVGYRYVDFQAPAEFHVTACSRFHEMDIEIWADREQIGLCHTTPTGSWLDWQTFHCPVKPVVGVKSLYLVFRGKSNGMGKRLLDVRDFSFTTRK